MNIKFRAFTDVGMKREANEDNYLALEEELCFVVADGMGGHLAGETASKMAVDTISEYITAYRQGVNLFNRNPKDLGEAFAQSIAMANDAIYSLSSTNASYAGMGTTVTGMLIDGDSAYVANVGDSRVYRLRSNQIKRITEDHSLFSDFVRRKEAQPEDEATFPYKNVITRALGVDSQVEVDIRHINLKVGDIYLICSDGLTGQASDQKLREILVDHGEEIEAAGSTMIDEANMNGGDDNITLILVMVTE